MPLCYSVGGLNVTVTNAVDLAQVFINPGTTCSLEFVRAYASQAANATSAQQTIALRQQATAFPTLTGQTPRKLRTGDPISQIVSGTAGAAGTSGINASVAGAGTKTEILDDNFNVLNGWLWVPTPKETVVGNAGSSTGIGVYFPVAPTTLTSWSVGMHYQEL